MVVRFKGSERKAGIVIPSASGRQTFTAARMSPEARRQARVSFLAAAALLHSTKGYQQNDDHQV